MDSGLTRRQVLQAGMAAGAAALAADPLVRVASALGPPPGKLTDIEHVIFLIQENRSFDHYYGTYSGVEGLGTAAAKAVYEQEGYAAEGFGGKLLPFRLTTNNVAQCFPDITHSWVPQHNSWNSGAMDNFVRTHIEKDGEAAGVATMGYYEKADIPFYRTLAEGFTLCDNYYCSVLGPTYPNRLYAMAGGIDPNGENGGPLIETTEISDSRVNLTYTTMAEQLQANGITWKCYQGESAGVEDNVLGLFTSFRTNPTLKKLGLEATFTKQFKKDLAHNELPQVSWINTSLNATEHPGNSSAKIGERVVSNLIKLLHHHGVWEKTALFITWDENGGFFDHVAPPVAPLGTPEEYLTVPDVTGASGGVTGPIGMGFRVPMVVVSPWSTGGLVSSQPYDHTSMLRFLETRFGVEVPNLSMWRRENAGDLTDAFNFAGTPSLKLPHHFAVKGVTPAEEVNGGCSAKAPVTVPPNSEPKQESGTRGTPSGIV
jgi:phospholipase C